MRAAALLAVGALGVHQGRYLAAFEGHAGSALSRQGHAYLAAIVTPVVIVLLALALARLLVRTLERSAQAARPQTRLALMWARSSAALLAIYVAQELAEGALAHEHPAGLAGVAGHGGWTALPLAVVVGALVALALRAAQAVESAPPLAGLAVRLRFSWPSASMPGPSAALPPARPELAEHLAGRGPPVLCR